VFFDEMDSIFRTRGSGVSSDVENHDRAPAAQPRSTAWKACRTSIVIGASNREDMIDPAILRPGRLDVKIKIERPDAEAGEGHLLLQVRADRAAAAPGRPGRARVVHARPRWTP